MAKEEKKEIKTEETPREIEIKTAMNVYQRLQKIRNELQKKNLKKTGKNAFTNATYYELSDFMPTLNELMDTHGVMSRFTLEGEKAVLVIFNSSFPEEKVVFYIPNVKVELAKALAIQSLGAQLTYLRRYLMMIAFEISESDAVDAGKPKETSTEKEADEIAIDKINTAKNLDDLAKTCATLKKELGGEYYKSLITHYTRRKKEIEKKMQEANAAKLADDVDKGLEANAK